MSDNLKNPISAELRKSRRTQYQALVQRDIDSLYTDAEMRALFVKSIILMAEEFLPDSVKNEIHMLHLKHKKYNQPEEELMAG